MEEDPGCAGGTLIIWVLKIAGPRGPFFESKLGQPPLAILSWGQQRQEAYNCIDEHSFIPSFPHSKNF